MAILFFVYLLAIALALAGWRKTALAVGILNLVLALAIFCYHVTTTIDIRL